MSDVEFISVTCSCGHPLTFILRSGERAQRGCDYCGASLSVERLSKEQPPMTPELFDAIERLRESRVELEHTVREELLENSDPEVFS
jgi:hypothetical protein